MTNLIFLGQVPLTNIYLNFWQWLALVAIVGIILTLIIVLVRHRYEIKAGILRIYVAALIRKRGLGFEAESTQKLA